MAVRTFFDPSRPVSAADFLMCSGLGVMELSSNYLLGTSLPIFPNLIIPAAITIIVSKIIHHLAVKLSGLQFESCNTKKIYSLVVAGFAVAKTIQLFGPISTLSLIVITGAAFAWCNADAQAAERASTAARNPSNQIIAWSEGLPSLYQAIDSKKQADISCEVTRDVSYVRLIYNPDASGGSFIRLRMEENKKEQIFYDKLIRRENEKKLAFDLSQLKAQSKAQPSVEPLDLRSLSANYPANIRVIIMCTCSIGKEAVEEIYKQLKSRGIEKSEIYFVVKDLWVLCYTLEIINSGQSGESSSSSNPSKPTGDALRTLRIKKFASLSSSNEKEKAPISEDSNVG